MSNDNYFDLEEENVVHDVFLMVISDETDYDDIEDVLLGETTFRQDALEWAKQRE